MSATVGTEFENFDAVVGVGIVRSGDVNGEIETHFSETEIDCGGRQNAGGRKFDAESFASGLEIADNPFRGFASVTGEKNFKVVAVGVIDETADDFSEKFGGELFGFTTDAVGSKILHISSFREV